MRIFPSQSIGTVLKVGSDNAIVRHGEIRADNVLRGAPESHRRATQGINADAQIRCRDVFQPHHVAKIANISRCIVMRPDVWRLVTA